MGTWSKSRILFLLLGVVCVGIGIWFIASGL